MIYKGIVIDIKDSRAVVMTEQAEFYKVIKKNNMIMGNQIIFLEEDIYINSFNMNKILRYAAVICILVFSMILLSQFKTLNENYYMPMAAVSVDINPSVELEINEDYKLLNVTSQNDEGRLIIDNNLIGKDIEEAMYMILLKAESENYITIDKNSVLIGYSIINEDAKVDLSRFEQNLSEKIKSNNNINYVNVILLQGDKDKLQESRQNDITIGKYLLYLNINTEGELEIEEAKSMSTEELLNYPKQFRNRDHGEDDSNAPKGNDNMNDSSGTKDSNNMHNEIEQEKVSNGCNENEECNNIEQENEDKKYRHQKGKN